jgi:hypothetical protein
MSENEAIPENQPPISAKLVRADDFASLYLNHIRIGATQWDIWMILGSVDENELGEPIAVERVRVQMTPAYAKAVAFDLNRIIKQYEDAIGEIKLPTQVAQAMKT